MCVTIQQTVRDPSLQSFLPAIIGRSIPAAKSGNRTLLRAAMLAMSISIVSAAHAAGDFPLASCKGWNGTIVEHDGIDTASASIRGVITKADLQEYCERDPGGETKRYGGKQTVRQCVNDYMQTERGATVLARANCRTGTIFYQYGNRVAGRARFPIRLGTDTSCASGMVPMIEQFKVLCPAAAKRLKIDS